MAIPWQQRLSLQDQVITRRQAIAGGMSAKAWEWRLAHGWTRLLPGIAAAHSGGVSERQQAWAAVLYAGEGAALSGDAALLALEMSGLRNSRLDVVVPWERRVVSVAGKVEVHRAREPARWISSVRGVPILNAHAAALHAAAWAISDRAAEWRLAAVVQQRISAVPLLRATLEQMPRLPRRALIREVLEDVEQGAHAGSELQYLRFCRAHGLPLPDELQLKVRVGRTRYVDAHYRKQKVFVEVDGAHHRMAAQWEADVLRSLQLAVARRATGEQVIRLTPFAMRHHATEVAALLQLLLGDA